MKTTTLIALAAAGAFAYVVITKKAQAATAKPVSNLNNNQQSAAPSAIPFIRFAAQDPKSLVTQVNANQANGSTDLFSYLFPNL